MSERNTNYGITIKNTLLCELQSKTQQRTILLGTIFKVETILGGNNLHVRFLKDGDTWDSVTFLCSRDDIVFISDKVWPYLAAVTSPKEKVKLAQNPKKCKKLMDINTDMTVGFEDHTNTYWGIVKYKGHVKGMGKCFGIQLFVRHFLYCQLMLITFFSYLGKTCWK